MGSRYTAGMKIAGRSSSLSPGIISARAIVRMFHRFELMTRNSDLSFAQYRILGYLQNGPRRAGELAIAAAVKKPTVSTLLNGLRQRGWIADRTDPVDGRVVKVVLTASGLTRLRAFDNQLAKTLESYLPEADLPRVLATLVDLYACLNEVTYAHAPNKTRPRPLRREKRTRRSLRPAESSRTHAIIIT
jgi:DNA-binding MarR family transcriptional regulator